MFGKSSLKVKLVAAFLVTASLAVLAGYYNQRAINDIHIALSHIVDNHVPRLNALHDMRQLASRIDSSSALYHVERDPADVAAIQESLLGDLRQLNDLVDSYLAAANGANSDVQQATRQAFEPIKAASSRTQTAVTELIDSKEQNRSPEMIATKEAALDSAEEALDGAISAAIAKSFATISDEDRAVDSRVEQFSAVTIVVAVFTGAVALVLGAFISFRIARNLRNLREGSARIASGDFSHRIEIRSRDELGELADAFNQMADSLRASYRRLDFERQRDETLLESMSDGLVAVDDGGKVVLVNTRAVELLDLSGRQEQQGRAIDEILVLFGEDDKPLAADDHPAKGAITTAAATSGVYSFHKKDSRKILINISTNPVVLEGKAAGAIMVIRDVTHEREVDRMKTEFISLASHQLRTPLSAIKWFTEMLVSGDAGKLTPEQFEFAKNVADSTERMIDLVNSLLNISRIESGRIMVEPKPTDLNELVGGIVNDLKAKTEERQQTLIVSVHRELPKVNLDARLIGQVYLNLLTNAIKYTPKGGEISVFVSRKDDELVSQVTDNGYGIPKDQQPRMFQKFFRATNVSKVETDGTGLGLYLIKAIVESSGGKIWFESEEGKGTTFWFSLPMSGMKPKEGEVTLDV